MVAIKNNYLARLLGTIVSPGDKASLLPAFLIQHIEPLAPP